MEGLSKSLPLTLTLTLTLTLSPLRKERNGEREQTAWFVRVPPRSNGYIAYGTCLAAPPLPIALCDGERAGVRGSRLLGRNWIWLKDAIKASRITKVLADHSIDRHRWKFLTLQNSPDRAVGRQGRDRLIDAVAQEGVPGEQRRTDIDARFRERAYGYCT